MLPKNLAVGVAVAMALALSIGCSPAAPTATAPPVRPLEEKPAAKTETAGAPATKTMSEAERVLAELAKLPEKERHEKLVEGAKKEGKIIGYVTGSIDSWEAFKKDFQNRYPGVTFEFLRDGSDELLERMLAEARAGKLVPDIITNSKIHVLEDHGLVIPYTSPAKERIPEKLRGDTHADFDFNPIVIAYNTNLVKPEDAPKKWEDLLEPKWKGRKIALDVMPDVMMYGFYSKWGVERGREFMRKLVAQDLVPVRSHTTAVDQLAAGEYPIVAEAYGYRVIQMKRDKKAPIAWVIPDPMPTTGGGIMIARTTRAPHAAALFYDYMMSPEAGNLYSTFGRIPVQPGAQMKYPEDQRPLLEAPGLVKTGPETYRKLYDIVMKDIKEIVQPVLGQ